MVQGRPSGDFNASKAFSARRSLPVVILHIVHVAGKLSRLSSFSIPNQHLSALSSKPTVLPPVVDCWYTKPMLAAVPPLLLGGEIVVLAVICVFTHPSRALKCPMGWSLWPGSPWFYKYDKIGIAKNFV